MEICIHSVVDYNNAQFFEKRGCPDPLANTGRHHLTVKSTILKNVCVIQNGLETREISLSCILNKRG